MTETNDWYRRTTWSDADAEDFEARLSRARGQRAEYLRVQALTLAEQGDLELARAAIGLAQRFLEENPNDFRAASVHLTLAKANVTIGDAVGALEAYRTAAAIEQNDRRHRCLACLEHAWFIATSESIALYDEALDSLQAVDDEDLAFPIAQFKYFGALALIADAQADPDLAQRMAKQALEAASREKGPFKRHPELGVATGLETRLLDRLRRLAE